jgi:CheY-like chemotaxis protein
MPGVQRKLSFGTAIANLRSVATPSEKFGTSQPLPEVLVVDDRPENALVLTAVLESSEYRVVTRSSGPEALEYLLDAGRCAVILMDVAMPGMDGFETVKRIRQRENARYIPVIFLSAIYLDHEHQTKGMQAGALDYLSKPFDPDTLKLKIDWLVNMYKRARIAQHETYSVREQAYKMFLSAPLPVVVTLGHQHRLELANDAWTLLAGERNQKGHPLREVMKELESFGLFDRMDEVFETGQRYEGKAVIFGFRNRGPVMLDILCEPWFDAQGNVERIVTFAMDVTSSVLSQHRLKNISRELVSPLLESKGLRRMG